MRDAQVAAEARVRGACSALGAIRSCCSAWCAARGRTRAGLRSEASTLAIMMAATVAQGMTHLRMSDISWAACCLSVCAKNLEQTSADARCKHLTDRRVCRVEASAASVGWCLQSVFRKRRGELIERSVRAVGACSIACRQTPLGQDAIVQGRA